MKNLFLSAAMMSAFAGMAFAANSSSTAPQSDVPELSVDKFLSAAHNMQEAIKNEDPVLEKFDLERNRQISFTIEQHILPCKLKRVGRRQIMPKER